ncbi:S8/S53 family peptidase [Polluticoccus soli]|uniref:S8/S53 family peptidase n=1 Tax=Polluticoccus soli TaxID=3034150 RepID=UPI0023E18A43|nr:S8/S53 family peptidase [Flavipsychrobacter sp. JY13-12]
MKHALLWSLLLLGAISQSFAQPYTFYLSIPDNSIITSVAKGGGTVTPTFNDPNINSIIGNYVVSGFNKAFPTSKYEYLRNVYKIQVDDSAILSDLRNYDSTLFPSYGRIDTVKSLSYTPGDWSTLGYDMGYLDFIGARDAWVHSKGHDTIIIGICDNYFDLNNPDLWGKVYYNGGTGVATTPADHGTAVAGYAAAATDTNGGVPAIGFNCRLDIQAHSGLNGDSVMLAISQRGRRITNASWYEGTEKHLTYPYRYPVSQNIKLFVWQGLYDEIYENGTLTVAAAGQNTGDTRHYIFPASFDHNISVTHIGWLNTDTVNPNVHDAVLVHERFSGDSTTFANHNDRVDICAPGLDLSGLTYDPNDPNKHWYNKLGTGTSFSAPLVSGTVGLMRTLKPDLTPYQMEWILKTQANKDIYDVSWNKKYKGSTLYNGRLGTGRLDAFAAVSVAKDFSYNNSNTTTFIIKTIKISTKCAPGTVVSVPNPQLTVELENGTPPYSYKWEPIDGNRCHVSPITNSGITNNSFTATIPGVLGAPYVFYYRLTVYDASNIQKVANKVIKFNLIDDANKWDLVMRDAFADTYEERNNMEQINAKNWNIWESPDLWVRELQDSIDIPQNPEYTQGVNNYVYSRVRNVGCAASPSGDSVRSKFYWTIASTGETWEDDWVGNTFINGLKAGDSICSKPLPSLNPGQEILVECAWQPPNPQNYDTAAKIEVCILARIIMPTVTNDGMTFAEDTLVKENIWNNNNIVTRNLVVTNFTPGAPPPKGTVIVVGNANNTPTVFTLEVTTGQHIEPYLHGHPGDYLQGSLVLGDLYDLWVDGGREGNATSYEDGLKTVYFDLHHPLRLGNLDIGAMQKYPVKVLLELNGNAVPFAVENERVWIRQIIERIDSVDNGDGTKFAMARDEVYGAVGFAINIEADEETEGKQGSQSFEMDTKDFKGYPNPTNENFTIQSVSDKQALTMITVVDITGRTVYSRKNIEFTNGQYQINTKALQPGVYFIKMIDKQAKHHSLKFMKVE